jgi:FkbM family methyltransferase
MSLVSEAKRHILKHFPHSARRVARTYRSVKAAVYARYFKLFPGFAFAIRELRQGARREHKSSFGMSLVGERGLVHGFEPEEIALVEEHLQSTDVFVDVGANIGLYTCLAASKGRPVVAIEPLASNLRYLYRNVLKNELKEVEIFPIGLSSIPGLSILKGIGPQASFLRDWAGADLPFNQHIENICPVSTLDNILGNRFAGKRLFIKIDVEGFEYYVLQGAIKTLEMSPKPIWMIECFMDKHHPNGKNPAFLQTFGLFFERGYKARIASLNGSSVSWEDVVRWTSQGSVDQGFYNFLFL